MADPFSVPNDPFAVAVVRAVPEPAAAGACACCDGLLAPALGLHTLLALRWLFLPIAAVWVGGSLPVGVTVILLDSPLPVVGVSIWMERGCQCNDCPDGF